MHIRLKILFALCAIFMIRSGTAQNAIQQQLIWLKYFNQWSLSDKLQIHTEIEERRYLLPDRVHQRFLPRVGLFYAASERIAFNVGAVYFHQYLPHDALSEEELFIEWRPHQYVQFTEQYGKFTLKSRVMVEQRFIETQGFGERTFIFNFRERTYFKLSYPIVNELTGIDASGIDAYIYDELMIQGGEGIGYNLFDQNRIGGGAAFQFNEHFTVDLSYFNWYQPTGNGVDFFSRHIFHLVLTHSI